MLEQELEFFEANKANWMRTYPDKFALVKGRELIGAFDTPDAAVTEGAKRFGSDSFLVRKITGTQDKVYIPSLVLGLLYADPA